MRSRRSIRRVQVGHHDDWLITYADTITLLLCLFVVLLALQRHIGPRVVENPLPVPSVQEHAVAVDFLDWKPLQRKTVAEEDVDAGAQDSPPAAASPAASVNAQTWPVADSLLLSAALDEPVGEPAGLAEPPASAAPPQPLREIAAQLQPEGTARLEQPSDRITTIAFDSAAFFGRGSAILSASGKVILQAVVGNLTSEAYRDYMVTIEGHTDDAPINTMQFPSNWELSTARAAAVVRFFVEQGVPAERLRAAGYADTHPSQPNRDGAGIAMPENQARNRRVVIGLEKIERH